MIVKAEHKTGLERLNIFNSFLAVDDTSGPPLMDSTDQDQNEWNFQSDLLYPLSTSSLYRKMTESSVHLVAEVN